MFHRMMMPTKSASFDPTTLSLDGYWRASFAGSPWTPTASAGTSGSNGNLAEVTNPPATGAAVNGFTPADFDGTNDILASASATSVFITASAWSMWALVFIDSIGTNSANTYDNDPIICESGGNWGIHLKSTGNVYAYHWDGADKSASSAISTSAWQLVQAKYDGTNLKCRVNGGSWGSTAAGNLVGGLSTTVFEGKNYNGGQFADLKILEAAISKSVISDANFDNVKSYCNSRYGLSL